MKCEHKWKEDELFKTTAVTMFFGGIGEIEEETRVICQECGEVDYVKKSTVLTGDSKCQS